MSTTSNLTASDRYVALLRGINVGGKHILPMKQLTQIFAECDCADVSTYIQSGNVIFAAGDPGQLAKTIAQRIEKRFGFAVPIILRSPKQMGEVIRRNPFLRNGVPEKDLHVYFLADRPKSEAVQTLDPQRSAPDAYEVSGSEIYLHLPNGMARTKLTSAYFDSRLATVCTARNWATVLKLFEMLQA